MARLKQWRWYRGQHSCSNAEMVINVACCRLIRCRLTSPLLFLSSDVVQHVIMHTCAVRACYRTRSNFNNEHECCELTGRIRGRGSESRAWARASSPTSATPSPDV